MAVTAYFLRTPRCVATSCKMFSSKPEPYRRFVIFAMSLEFVIGILIFGLLNLASQIDEQFATASRQSSGDGASFNRGKRIPLNITVSQKCAYHSHQSNWNRSKICINVYEEYKKELVLWKSFLVSMKIMEEYSKYAYNMHVWRI